MKFFLTEMLVIHVDLDVSATTEQKIRHFTIKIVLPDYNFRNVQQIAGKSPLACKLVNLKTTLTVDNLHNAFEVGAKHLIFFFNSYCPSIFL